MNHAQLTDAVRAAENLSASSAERHGTYANRSLVPGSNAGTAIRAGAHPSHARQPVKPGPDGRAGGSTRTAELNPADARLAGGKRIA